MVHLTLVGLSADRTRVLLVDDAGQEYDLAVGPLRSALRGVDPRPGQLEIQMDSALRPRDIQARIRAGETPEAVAQAAQAPLERIMPYAAPVLAERAHVAERAQRSSVRRRPTEGSGPATGARTLGEAVRTHLRSQGIQPDSVEWDAYRREDGRWTLTAGYQVEGRARTATFAFDVPGSYVTVDDEAARWLIGEAPARPARPEPGQPSSTERDATRPAPARRLSAVDSEQLPLGEDALELVAEGEARGDQGRAERGHRSEPATGAETEAERTLELTPTTDADAPTTVPDPAPTGATQSAEDPSTAAEPAPEDEDASPVAKRRGRKGRGRASVPSWDEIMFGGGRGE